MDPEKVVSTVNAELKAMREEAANHRENPRIIQLMDSLIKLTNSEEDNAELEAAKEPAPPSDAEILAAFKAGKLVAK